MGLWPQSHRAYRRLVEAIRVAESDSDPIDLMDLFTPEPLPFTLQGVSAGADGAVRYREGRHGDLSVMVFFAMPFVLGIGPFALIKAKSAPTGIDAVLWGVAFVAWLAFLIPHCARVHRIFRRREAVIDASKQAATLRSYYLGIGGRAREVPLEQVAVRVHPIILRRAHDDPWSGFAVLLTTEGCYLPLACQDSEEQVERAIAAFPPALGERMQGAGPQIISTAVGLRREYRFKILGG